MNKYKGVQRIGKICVWNKIDTLSFMNMFESKPVITALKANQ